VGNSGFRKSYRLADGTVYRIPSRSMSDTERCDQIESRLIALGQRIGADALSSLRHPAQATMPEWSGADVRITSDFSHDPQGFIEAHDLLVRTQHAVPLTWLLLEVRDAFGDLLDASNKYGFYGSLAQSAMQHLAANQPEPDDPRPLLRAVLASAFDWLPTLRSEGEIPANAEIVIHTQDAEGRQRRIDPETGEDTR
jgi:hypothetical protein